MSLTKPPFGRSQVHEHFHATISSEQDADASAADPQVRVCDELGPCWNVVYIGDDEMR